MTAHPVLPDGPCCPDTILTVSTSSETRSSVSTQSRSHTACSVRQLPNAQETLEKRQRPSPRAPRAAATCFGSTSLGPGKRRLSPQTAHSCGHQPKRPLPGCGAWKEDPRCGMGDEALQRSPAAPRAALGSLRSVGRWPRRSLHAVAESRPPRRPPRRSLANGAASGVCRILGRDVETLPRQGARTQAWRAQLSKTDRGLHIAFVPYLYNDTTRRVHWALNRGP